MKKNVFKRVFAQSVSQPVLNQEKSPADPPLRGPPVDNSVNNLWITCEIKEKKKRFHTLYIKKENIRYYYYKPNAPQMRLVSATTYCRGSKYDLL